MEIVPDLNTSSFYEPGGRLSGTTSSGLSDFIDVGTKNLEELKTIIKAMSSVFGSEDISFALKELVFSLQDTAENMEKIVSELSKISSSNKISKILNETEQLLLNINHAVGKEDYEKLSDIIQNLEVFSQGLKDLTEDGELKESVILTLDETRSTFEKSNSFFNTLSKIKLLTGASLNSYGQPKAHLIYNLDFNFWLENSWLGFGVSNYYNQDQLMNILVNFPLQENIRLSWGLMKLSPGVGMTYAFQNIPINFNFRMWG